jgi:proteic killer suppression protein
MNLPGLGFHSHKGNRKGTYSVIVSGNWRITFQFEGENAVNVDLEDYH